MTRYLLPVIAVAMAAFAISYVIRSHPQQGKVALTAPPPRSPYENSVAGAGIIESSSENISVGSPAAGIVVDVFAKVGQTVAQGDPLFRLDDRSLKADLNVRAAALDIAKAELQRLKGLPRSEEVPQLEARVKEAEANLAAKKDNWQRTEPLVKQNAISQSEAVRTKQEYKIAQAQLDRAHADLKLLEAGAWGPEIAAARANVQKAAAELAETHTELDRLTVRARIDAHVLQVNVHPGEYVTAFANQSLVVLGNLSELHVRVDIDENDIPRFQPGAPAIGMLKGRTDAPMDLTFVRVDPYVMPKRSLTGENVERVDTRVLQVIYEIGETDLDLYVGQQIDVFIQAK